MDWKKALYFSPPLVSHFTLVLRFAQNASFTSLGSYSACYPGYQPLFPQGKLLPYSKTLFTMFSLLLAKFLQIISVEQHFLSSLMPTRISKVHVSWWLKKTRNFKDFLHTLYKSCFFRSWKETDPGNNFLWGQVISMFTPASHWELFISARRQTTCQTDVMNNFFLPQHYTKGIQSSADGTSQLTTFSLTFAHIASVFSRFSAHSYSQLVASLTSRQIYKHILALKEFSQTIFLSRKQAFKFELLFYCLITVSTLCQPHTQTHINVSIGPIVRHLPPILSIIFEIIASHE